MAHPLIMVGIYVLGLFFLGCIWSEVRAIRKMMDEDNV